MPDTSMRAVFRALDILLADALKEHDPELSQWFAETDQIQPSLADWQQAVTKAQAVLVGFRTADNPIIPPQAP